MKTICALNGRIILSQDGEARAAMEKNASQYPGAVVSVVTDDEFASLLAAQPVSIEEQRAEIERQRDAQLAAGFAHAGHAYHCDETFQAQVQGYLAAWREGILPEGVSVPIRRRDNTTAQMTRAEVVALAGALLSHVQGIWAASWAAKDAL